MVSSVVRDQQHEVDYSSWISVFCKMDGEETDVFFYINEFVNGGSELFYLLLEFLVVEGALW
jgi:hypothetical protein